MLGLFASSVGIAFLVGGVVARLAGVA
jgi:hypothetical protein